MGSSVCVCMCVPMCVPVCLFFGLYADVSLCVDVNVHLFICLARGGSLQAKCCLQTTAKKHCPQAAYGFSGLCSLIHDLPFSSPLCAFGHKAFWSISFS